MPRSKSSPWFPLRGERVELHLFSADAAERQLDYYLRNRRHLEPWEPPRPPGFFSVEYWRWRLEHNQELYEADQGLRLQLVLASDPEGDVLGQIGFNQVVRGALQQCALGYSLDERHVGQGYMTEGLKLALPFVFQRLAFHRVTASYLPHNQRSAALLARLGFVIEGRAAKYLYVQGAWRDHVITALINHDLEHPGLNPPVPCAGESSLR